MIEYISTLVPISILINFILCGCLLHYNRKYFFAFLARVDKIIYGKLFVVFLIALFVRLFIPPIQHIMYVDEPWYMEAAKNILHNFNQGDYPKSIGWPLLLAYFFLFFGVNNWVALYAMIFIGALMTVALFFLSSIVVHDRKMGLLAALFIAFYPVHIRWSASAETNVVSLFIVCCAFIMVFFYYQKRTLPLLWLAMAAVSFAAQFRPENYALFLVFLFGDFLYGRKWIFENIKYYLLAWVVFLLLSAPNLIHILKLYLFSNFLESDSHGLVSGKNWSLHNLIINTKNYGIDILAGEYQPVFISFFGLIGSIVLWVKERRLLIFLVFWAVLFYLIYFSSWLQTMGGRERLFMMMYPSIIILSAVGLGCVLDLILEKLERFPLKCVVFDLSIIVLILLFIPYAKKASVMFNGKELLLETKIPEMAERDIPDSCVIVANWPTILKSTTDLQVIDARGFLQSQTYQKEIFAQSGCVLFFEDLTCRLWPDERNYCLKIKKQFGMKEYRMYDEGLERFGFYQLSERKP